jgi:hypothetical protein
MSWKKERDALIAQTMAFVQSVTGRKDENGRLDTGFAPAPPARPVLPEPIVNGSSVHGTSVNGSLAAISPVFEPVIRIAEPPPSPPAPASRPIVPSEMTSEIRARIATFRAHQERFNREREEYFSATLARLKAAIRDNPLPPHDK